MWALVQAGTLFSFRRLLTLFVLRTLFAGAEVRKYRYQRIDFWGHAGEMGI